MRDEADGWCLPLEVSLQGGIDITLIVHLNIAETFALQLLLQIVGKHQLFRSAWHAVAVFSRLRVKLGIVQKSFSNVHIILCLHVVNHLHKLLAQVISEFHGRCLAIDADDRFGI